jgi:hypothetical protein
MGMDIDAITCNIDAVKRCPVVNVNKMCPRKEWKVTVLYRGKVKGVLIPSGRKTLMKITEALISTQLDYFWLGTSNKSFTP